MANRVLLNTSGLKVSEPGFDVLTAGNANLQFSSDWSALTLLLAGGVNVPASTSQTVFFGRTFIRTPIAIVPWNGFGQDSNYYYLTLSEMWAATSIATLYNNRIVFANPYSTPYFAWYYIWNYG
ncbi:hypothetical protein C3Y94_026190 [Rhizobium ruizarguesonis]|uniref:hypothetical protein n=1 Tax=Rhizobium ruizarguesonis TaxID=2081791 RepID=UPI00163A2FAE|nr:hypothetical protein [Rhizobium ruizarguesonis]MBC2806646.1 hypothetical protein [Rhizobium ruizarguesonis]